MAFATVASRRKRTQHFRVRRGVLPNWESPGGIRHAIFREVAQRKRNPKRASPPNRPEEGGEPTPPDKKRPLRWRFPLIVIGSIVGVVSMFVLAVIVFIGLAREEPVTEADKDVLVTAAHFVEWVEDFEVDTSLETFKKIRNIDRSYELEYEYDAGDFYVSCSVGVDRTLSDARVSYVALIAGVSIGASISDSEWRERPELMRWGDQSKCALFYIEGRDEPAGNLFACRKGKRTFLLILSGTWFDDAETFREFLEPVLRKFDRYDPA